MTREEAIKKGILENKIVKLKPIKRAGKMIKDPKHIGYFMFNDAFKIYPLPRSRRTGSFIPILTSDELTYFNKALQRDLSFTKKDDNFWEKYNVRITKDDKLMKDGKDFNLSDPYENLDYRIIQSLSITAPSYEKRYDSPKYIWYFTEENEELAAEAKKTAKTQEVWIFFGAISNSKKKMIDILSVYYAEKARENEVDINNSREWFIEEIKKVATEDPDFLLECRDNDDYIYKALITDAVRAGAIKKTQRNRYEIQGDSNKYDFIALVKLLRKLKENTDDDYLIIKKTVEEYNKTHKLKE